MADKKISQLTAVTTPLAGSEELPIVQSGETRRVTSDNLTVKNLRSNVTTGLLQIAGPGAGTTRTMTVPNANFSAARIDAAQTFTGLQTFASTGGDGLRVYGAAGTHQWDIYLNSTNLRISDNTGSGYVQVDTDLNLNNGNLIIGTAGKGIDFSVNSAAAGMTSELLDDYETGTWTPTYTPASGAFGTIVYNSNTFGRYTKVGNCVFVVGLIITDEFNVGTGVGQGRISGLPFTPSPSASASINYSTGFNTNHPTGSFTSGADIYLTQRATSLGASATFNSASFTTGVSSFGNYVYFHMNYTV
jgi:hypothetical protein